MERLKTYVGMRSGELVVLSEKIIPPDPKHSFPCTKRKLTVQCSCCTVTEIFASNLRKAVSCGDYTKHSRWDKKITHPSNPKDIVNFRGKSKPFDVHCTYWKIRNRDITHDLVSGKPLLDILIEHAPRERFKP